MHRYDTAPKTHMKYSDFAVAGAPTLKCIIRFQGKTYSAPKGGDHVEALSKVPKAQRQDAMLHGDRLFVTSTGKVLNRRAAQKYAVENDMLAAHIPWAKTAPELISEYLRPDALESAIAKIDHLLRI